VLRAAVPAVAGLLMPCCRCCWHNSIHDDSQYRLLAYGRAPGAAAYAPAGARDHHQSAAAVANALLPRTWCCCERNCSLSFQQLLLLAAAAAAAAAAVPASSASSGLHTLSPSTVAPNMQRAFHWHSLLL
jgi:hypothetical protein